MKKFIIVGLLLSSVYGFAAPKNKTILKKADKLARIYFNKNINFWIFKIYFNVEIVFNMLPNYIINLIWVILIIFILPPWAYSKTF